AASRSTSASGCFRTSATPHSNGLMSLDPLSTQTETMLLPGAPQPTTGRGAGGDRGTWDAPRRPPCTQPSFFSGSYSGTPRGSLHSAQLLLGGVQGHAEGRYPGQWRRHDRAVVMRIRAARALGLDGLQAHLGVCRRIGVLDGAGGRVVEVLPLLGLLDEQLLR